MYHVPRHRFEELVEQALAELPDIFAEHLEEVPVEICDRPTPQQAQVARAGGILLGLYQGRPLTERSVEDSGRLPDVIYIFRENIERVVNSEQDLIEQVRTTVLHEIGHHFGMSEADLEKYGYG
jgi:predicted Zn-dependent protease with MMP-like domain